MALAGTRRKTPAELTLYHGTSAARARAIRQHGFSIRGPYGQQLFLTSAPGLAGDYGDVVLPVRVRLANPLRLNIADGALAVQLAERGVVLETMGGYLQASTIAALQAAGHDALIIDYPPDNSDPSDPQPARAIARVFDAAGLTLLD